jgi:regulator of protease activity HflC (stomatin/prohibitin superfamily)
MRLLPKKVSVKPNTVGFLYRNNKFTQRLEAGVYRIWEFFTEIDVVILPTTNRLQTVLNQEVLTKDNIAFRFSYFVQYRIFDGEKFLAHFDAFQYRTGIFQRDVAAYQLLNQAEALIHSLTQVYLRNIVADITSEEINEKRNAILSGVPDELKAEFEKYGIEIESLLLRDVTFPKQIQDLFAKQLEAKIRGKSDLENARTAVATARALKNASELMKDDENIKFVQVLETINKIADKGKHTFVIGEIGQNGLFKKQN